MTLGRVRRAVPLSMLSAVALVSVALAHGAAAQQPPPPPGPSPGSPPSSPRFLPNDPKRPVEAISRDLGITPDQFVTCFTRVQPAERGMRPTEDRVHANKAVLLPCLKAANPSITNDMLDTVMDRHRPGGREAQRPVR